MMPPKVTAVRMGEMISMITSVVIMNSMPLVNMETFVPSVS